MSLSGSLTRMFRSFKEPNYRRFVSGHAVSIAGTWMQRVAQDWLVLELTDSAIAVGIATSLQFLPMLLLGVWGGVIADRFDRRRLLLKTQAVSAVLAAALAVCTLAGVATIELVYGFALGLGLVTVVDVPTRQVFISDLVQEDDFVNAQSLNSTVHNLGRLVGPAVAGLLIASFGVGVAFSINALSFVAVLLALWRIDPSKLHYTQQSTRGKGQARDGLRYVWGNPEIRACLALVAVVALLGQNFRVVLPLLARDTFDGGAEVYGWLTSALGLGAVVGALASATRVRATPRSLLVWTLAFGLVNLLSAITPTLLVALLAMVALGIANITVNTLGRTVLLLHADPAMRGRVIALHGMVFLGSTPFGGPLLGWVCEVWGPRAGFVVAGVSALLIALAMLPKVRALEAGRRDTLMRTPPPPGAADLT
ncbi:MAG: MFS transporter [Nocardioidaceae bacterium]